MTQAFEPQSRCVKRCATQYSIDATRFLSAATNRASYSLLVTSCFNFETDILVFFLFFWLIRSRPANQLFLVYGEANGSICQVPRGQEAFFCRGRLLHMNEDATLLSVLRVALGDNESLKSTLRILTPET